jgi:hypothetical protein
MRLLPLLPLLLASCAQQPPTAAECKALADPKAVIKRCYGGNIGPSSASYIGDLKCWPFSKPQHLVGIWVISLEASVFFPKARTLDDVNKSASPTWMESGLIERRPELLASAQGANTRIYAVDFEGRQTLCDGMFGHFGTYRREVIAERFHSMRLVQLVQNVP